MFEKTLTDVVKGIRASKRGTSAYISQCIAEIKTELNSSDMFVKANALQKLTFFQMMGFSMNWDRASFATIEVMSSPRFAHKRVGCLAASQGFTQETEVILLTTNLLKKELRGAVGGGMQGVYDAGLAINCISNIVTEDLARDLLSDLTNLTSHPQPYLRKKAILCLFKLFIKYPQGLRLTFARLQQCLEDPNSSVVSCAVNVITELSDKNPKNYLHLAPAFFQLLTQSSNNWMLIKVVKLLGSLVPEEPRLARKLLTPLSVIVRNTQAKSLLYESVRTITLCLPYCHKADGSMPANVPELVDLCANTLLDFVTQADQNLKYLGLVGFGSLMQSHPQVLSDPKYRPLILTCLSDQDVTIRSRALDLLTAMANRKNLVELVTQLLKHVELASGTYKNDLVAKIIEMCSGDKYTRMPDFKWFLDVIFQLGHVRGIEKHGDLLRAQVTNISLRVVPVRPYAVLRSMEILLEGDGDASDDPLGDNGRGKHLMSQLLPGLAWTIGEYSDQIQSALSIDPDEQDDVMFSFDGNSQGTYHAIVQCLTSPVNTQKLPTPTQIIYIQSALKVLAAASSNKSVHDTELEACVQTLRYNLPAYLQSTNVEVVERSFTFVELMKALGLSARPVVVQDIYNGGNNGDLLGIENATEVQNGDQSKRAVNGIKSFASNAREVSATLVYLLKPSPMKPLPQKSQKSKRQATIGVAVDIDAPVDLSIFQALIAEEEAYRANISSSLEAVSFTQQIPYRAEDPVSMRSYSVLVPPANVLLPSGGVGASPAISFQRPDVPGTTSSSSKARQNDPFYLESKPSGGAFNDGANNNRFGMIQLNNSDDEDIEKLKRKKRKQKRAKKPQVSESSWDKSDLAHFGAFDDEDEEATNTAKGRGKGFDNDFDGLAKVDLTTPLREDEIMPERTHRVVPDRHVIQETRKKSKKPKKASQKISAVVSHVGDLLDLDSTFDVVIGQQQSFAGGSSIAHPINTAFDDLLSMPMPDPNSRANSNALSPASTFTNIVTGSSVPSSGSNQGWLRVTVKFPATDSRWSEVSILSQVSPRTEGGAWAVLRIDNASSEWMRDVSVDFASHGRHRLDDIAPLCSSNVSAKFGPFVYDILDTNKEVKGLLTVGTETGIVKLVIPATFLLYPQSYLSLEQLTQEMTMSGWSSSTAKVNLGAMKDSEEVKSAIATFLNSALVLGISTDKTSGTFAAQSSSGTPVRFLIKVKDKHAKVDVKSTSSSLCKALSSDLKRLVLPSR